MEEQSDETTNTYEAYRNIADNRGQAVKVEFRFKNGEAEQYEYSYLTRTTFKPAAGKLTLKFMDAIVTIEGTNLTKLKDDLRHNKVEWIQEAESEFENVNIDSVFIKKISVDES